MIEGANGHTFHYNYTLNDYMWQLKLELELETTKLLTYYYYY